MPYKNKADKLAYMDRQKIQEISCLNCGKYHVVSKYRENPQFCSVKCGSIYTSTTRGDVQRGKGFNPKTYTKYRGKHLHRQVMEMGLGRTLLKNEIVHHIDGNTKNNKPTNLQVVTREEHGRIHATKNRKCSVPNCGLKHHSLCYCHRHYRQFKRLGKFIN